MGLPLRDRINLTHAPAMSAAAVLLLIAGGCSQQSNRGLNPLTLLNRPHTAEETYAEFVAEQHHEARLRESRDRSGGSSGDSQLSGSWGQGHTARAILAMTTTGPRFESPQTTRRVNASDSQAHQREIQFTTPAGKPATGRSTTVQRLGLFGEFPGVGPIARSSPLDSQGNIRPVSFSTEGGDFDPDPDPTGQWLVYASTRHRETADLYIKRIDGTTVTQLTSDPADDRMPAFRPDGKAIAFASDRGGTWDLYLVGMNDDKLVQLTNDPTHEIHPSFSPDGKRLVYCAFGTQSGQWELVVLDLANPTLKRFVGFGQFPHWSPTSDRIVFQRARERGSRLYSIWTLDLVDGEALRPTEIAASANAAAITPHWSPDGKRIVFCTVVDPSNELQHDLGKADLWTINADGTSRVNLTRSSFVNVQPVWSPDGTIFFVSDRSKNGVENIWSLRPSQSNWGRFAGAKDAPMGPAPVLASPAMPESSTVPGGDIAMQIDTKSVDVRDVEQPME